MNKNKKILVAMSGGVDSSVAAALLKNQGFDVFGVFIIFQPQQKQQYNPRSCCSLESQASAKRIAQILNIPFYTLDMSVDFKKLIINDFVQEYGKGNTPNPCIRCNKYIKFGKLLEMAKKLECDYVATGHYAKIRTQNTDNRTQKRYKLITAKDKSKDQSYFLYELTQEKLKHIMFPLSQMHKTQVKKLAKKFNLPTYSKKESSDVCFVNAASLRDFLKPRVYAKPGDIIDVDGKKIGQHTGLEFYTIGQRQGINIGGTGPYYVVEKNFDNNQLIVTNDKNDKRLYKKELTTKNINWISGQPPQLPFKCFAQHRYQTQMSKVEVKKEKKIYVINYVINYVNPQRAITPGQSIVFYKPLRKFFNSDFEVLGGGVIK